MDTASHANRGESIETFRDRAFGFTPDEKELWISDQAANAVYVFDNTVFPPKQSAKIDISKGGHGWVAGGIACAVGRASPPPPPGAPRVREAWPGAQPDATRRHHCRK